MTNARPTAKARLKAPGVGLCTHTTIACRVWVGETIDIYAAVYDHNELFHNVYMRVHGCPRPCSRIPHELCIFFVLPTRVTHIGRRRYPYGKFLFFFFAPVSSRTRTKAAAETFEKNTVHNKNNNSHSSTDTR